MGWLGSFFKKLWNAIRKVLAVILVIAAIIIAVWACLITGGAALPLLYGLSTTMMYVVSGLCLVGAFIIDKKTAQKTVGKVADAVGDAAESVGTVGGAIVGGAVGGAIGGLLDNPIVVMAAVGVVAYLLLSSGDDSTAARPEADTRRAGTGGAVAVTERNRSSTDAESVIVGDPLVDDMGELMYA